VPQAHRPRSHYRHRQKQNSVRVLALEGRIQTLPRLSSSRAKQATSRYQLLESLPKGTEPSLPA